MELFLKRTERRDTHTIGQLTVQMNGRSSLFNCFTLEDKDRALSDNMSLSDIDKVKIKHDTAIPTGRYEVIINYSNRFKTYMPLLLNVKGFEGIRIHTGNTQVDTSGCILVGYGRQGDKIIKSLDAYKELMKILKAAERKEKIYITIN